MTEPEATLDEHRRRVGGELYAAIYLSEAAGRILVVPCFIDDPEGYAPQEWAELW